MNHAKRCESQDERRSERVAIRLEARCRTSSWNVGDATLANISREGCCLAVARNTWAVGQPVLIRASGARLPGMVRWTADDRVGVEFDAPIDETTIANLMDWAEISG